VQTRGAMEGRDAHVPVVVPIIRHFYYSSQTSGFDLINYVDILGAANDDISPQA